MDLTVFSSGNTAWMLVATTLVLLMTLPGIALFYGGLVRGKNVLSLIMQSLFIAGAVTLMWIAFGYSFVFGENLQGTALGSIIGGTEHIFLQGISPQALISTGIPELLFVMFQCMFALITPALIIGGVAERMKFRGFMVFILLWGILSYLPMAHWVWGGGFLMEMGAIDFAGGTVVHINAGISALVLVFLMGKRKDFRPSHPIVPHNVPFVFMGTAFLWLGWFGFNAGSGLAADGIAANALLVTHVAAAMAAIVWSALEWTVNKKPTVVGTCTGAVAGLVAITPAAGTTDVIGALFIGALTSLVCYTMVAVVKNRFGYDDSLDAFGVHGMGGIVGSILTGVFATQATTGSGGLQGALYGDWHQLFVQIVATLFTIVYSVIITGVLFKLVDKLIGLRVEARVEEEGLDIYEHGESAYN